MSIDLSTLSRAELERLKDDVEKAIVDANVRERTSALRAAEKAAAEFGFTLSEITSDPDGKRKGSKTVGIPKYFNPEDPAQTWTGKGRQPAWFKAALSAGTDPATMEI